MYNYLFRFTPARYDDEYIYAFSKALDGFFSALVRNGLIIDGWRSGTVVNGGYECRCAAFDEHSLDEDNFNGETRVALTKLTKLCTAMPQLEYVGINCDLEGSCRCEQPTSLVLFADMDSDTSPVLCTDCHRGFPLRRFRLNGYFEDFDSLLAWQQLYKSFRCQLLGSMGEAFAYMMLHRPDSQLSLEGRRLAKQLELSSGIVTYYYLLTKNDVNPPLCPVCGRPWKSEYPDALGFEYSCQSCRLVSNDDFKRGYFNS